VRLLKRTFVAVCTLVLMVVIAGLFIWTPVYRQAVADATSIDSKLVVHSSDPSTIVASDGTVLYRISMQRRNVVAISTLPKYVRDAVVAAEDRRFYTHQGVDLTGLLRSTFLAVRDRRASQGASTIDMQLAKNLVNGDERSFDRKLRDIATAQQIDKLKSKDEILNLYMNEVYFGQGAWGIEAAAETYFGKHAAKLDIAEAAMLARCIRHPSRDNPIKDPKGSIDRRNYVLGVMRDENWIDETQYEKAVTEEPKIDRYTYQGVSWINPTAGYFVGHVLSVFHDDYPNIDLQEGGYRIETTLNYALQKKAVEAVASTLREHHAQAVTDAAIVVMDSQGRILAEQGGPGYEKNKFNIITQSHSLQPGSSFKPFVYATALKEGVVHMGEELSNEPIYEDRYGTPWEPRNNGKERIGGYVGMETAFASSINLPAIHTLQKVGAEKVVSYAHDTFGFEKSHIPPFESLALGTAEVYPLEMAKAYSVFMLRGDRVDPYPIDRIIAPDGEALKVYSPNKVSTGFDSEVCDDIDQLMRAVVEHGTGTAALEVPDARGKTGTTQDAKDAWFCGYSDGILAVSWCGNMQTIHGTPHRLPMRSSVFGGTVTCGMWAQVMMKAHDLHLTHVTPPPVEQDRVATRAKPLPKRDEDSVKIDEDKPDEPDVAKPPKDDALTSEPGTPIPPPDDQVVEKPKTKPKKLPEPKKDDSNDPSDAPKPKAVARSSESRQASDEDSDYVTVEICADTGMRAGKYCPETVARRYRKGTEPRQVCRLHTGN
jgi:penicillin-binding protein 1A